MSRIQSNIESHLNSFRTSLSKLYAQHTASSKRNFFIMRWMHASVQITISYGCYYCFRHFTVTLHFKYKSLDGEFNKETNNLYAFKLKQSVIHNCRSTFFTCFPTQSARLAFIGEKLVLEKSELPLILFYFKRENKTKKNPLKKWLRSFWKSMSLKNLSLGSGIRSPIGKIPLKGNTPLSPTKVSTN